MFSLHLCHDSVGCVSDDSAGGGATVYRARVAGWLPIVNKVHPMTKADDNVRDKQPRDRDVVIWNLRYAGAMLPGDVVRTMARFRRNRPNRGNDGKKPA